MIEMTDVLKCGDCLTLLQELPPASVDLVLCDLPYGVSRNEWDTPLDLRRLWSEYRRVVKENGAIILFGSGMFTADLMLSNRKWWRYNLIWEKTTPTGFLNANRMPLRKHEDICVFYKKLPVYHPQKTQGHVRKISTAHHARNSKMGTGYGEHHAVTYDSTERYPGSVLKFPTDKQRSALHATQKPVALCEWIIRTYSDPGDTVLDNCMGSGTTCVAAKNTGRHYIGFEKNPDIFEVAKQRINGIECLESTT